MVKVTCLGLGSESPPTTKEIPSQDQYGPHMSTQGVQVLIPLSAYERLVNWASVRRTLNGVLSSNEDSLDELHDISSALAECHEAIRQHWKGISQ